MSVGDIARLAAGGAGEASHVHLMGHTDSCESCRAALAAAVRGARSTEPDRDAAVVDDFESRARIGRYVIADLLGEGGMGRVYAAYDPELARTIALKVLRAAPNFDALARLSREAQLTAQLSHPNVVSVYDIGKHGAQVYVAMELVAGETLRAWLATEPRGWREIVDAFVQAGRGVAAAHAAGVVHRDIKPDNIFMGRDGRVRIGDFGLARVADEAVVEPTADATQAITRTGAVIGTIPYMAPEQLDGIGSDDRSDQYAFCVSLYEALYGQRPFAGATVADLRTAIAGGPPAVPNDPTPRWLRAAVVRGLAREPRARFESMNELLAALSFDPMAKRRRIVLGAVGIAALAAIVIGSYAGASSDPCSDAPAAIGEVWNKQLAATLGASWRTASIPNATATWDRVAPALDRYASGWATSARAACRATRVDRSQSDALLELRTLCLDRSKQELAAVVAALRAPTPAIAEGAVKLVDGMQPLAHCSNLDALRARVPPPRDAAAAKQIEDLQTELRQVDIARRTSQHTGLDKRAASIVERATELGYAPAIAEAWIARGDVARALGDAKAAEAAYYEALWAAEAGRDQRAVVVAWSQLLETAGVERARLDDGLRLFNHADAALRGLGSDHRLRANIEIGAAKLFRDRGEYDRATAALDRARTAAASGPDEGQLVLGALEHTAGTIALALGRYDDALASFQKAHDLRVKALGPQHPDVARAMLSIGNIYKDRKDYPRALTQYQAAWDLLKASVPAAHPTLAAAEGNLALVLLEQGKYDEALVHQRSALAIFEQALGPDHPSVGKELNNVGLTLTYSKRAAEALPYFERARTLFIKAAGPAHLDVSMTEHNLGNAYMQMKDDAQAEARYRASIAIREKASPEHPELARTLSQLAALMTRSNRFDPAAELLARAITIYDKVHGPTNPILSKPLLDLGWIRNQQKKHADAIEPLERVLGIHTATKNKLLAVSRMELATALWESNRDRPRAVDLVKLVKQDLDPKTQAKDVAEAEAWLAKHRLR